MSVEVDLSRIFRSLDNNQVSDAMLQKEKARLKLTVTTQEREHTRKELEKMESVRRFLLDMNIIDDGFIDS